MPKIKVPHLMLLVIAFILTCANFALADESKVILQGAGTKSIVRGDLNAKLVFDWSKTPGSYYNRTTYTDFYLKIGNCDLKFYVSACSDCSYPRVLKLGNEGNSYGYTLIQDKRFTISVDETKVHPQFTHPDKDWRNTDLNCLPQFDKELVPGRFVLNVSLSGDVYTKIFVELPGEPYPLVPKTTTTPLPTTTTAKTTVPPKKSGSFSDQVSDSSMIIGLIIIMLIMSVICMCWRHC